MMSLWDALRMNMMISYQELVRTFPSYEEQKNKNIIFNTEATSLAAFFFNIAGRFIF
ncbi:hypothetical protein [Escherichia coli]